MPTYTAIPFTTQAGTFTLSFTGPGADYTVEVKSIGDLKYELSIPNKDGDIDRVGLKMGQMEVVFFDEIGQNLSLYELLFGSTFATYGATLDWVDKFGVEREQKFEFDQESIKYNALNRLTTIQFNPPSLKADALDMADFFVGTAVDEPASLDTRNFTYNGTDLYDAVRAGDFIKTYIKTLGGVLDADIIFRSGATTGTGVTATIYTTGSPVVDQDTYLIADVGTLEESERAMSSVVADLAVMEGAIFGYAFGKAFYLPRIDNTDKVFLDYTQVETWEYELLPRNIATVAVTINFPDEDDPFAFNLTPPPNLVPLFTNIATINPAATRNVGIVRAVGRPFLNKARWNTTDWDGEATALFPFNPSTGAQTTNLELSLVSAGVDNYTSTFTGRRIKLTIWGMTSLNPWECFEFGTDAPARLRGKIWRPSSIRYKIMTDKLEIEAYEITDSAYTPAPDLSITSISPTTATEGVSVTITVTGTGFTAGTALQVINSTGIMPVTTTAYTNATTMTITITPPTGSAGKWSIQASKPGQIDTLIDALTVSA